MTGKKARRKPNGTGDGEGRTTAGSVHPEVQCKEGSSVRADLVAKVRSPQPPYDKALILSLDLPHAGRALACVVLVTTSRYPPTQQVASTTHFAAAVLPEPHCRRSCP